MKKLRFFIFNLCIGFVMWAWSAEASPCKGYFESTPQVNESDVSAEESASTTLPESKIPPSKIRSVAEAPEETGGDVTTENMARDAVGGAGAGLAIDAVTGEEISLTGIATDAALGVGTGVVIRTVAPDLAREVDNFVDDIVDDFFDW